MDVLWGAEMEPRVSYLLGKPLPITSPALEMYFKASLFFISFSHVDDLDFHFNPGCRQVWWQRDGAQRNLSMSCDWGDASMLFWESRKPVCSGRRDLILTGVSNLLTLWCNSVFYIYKNHALNLHKKLCNFRIWGWAAFIAFMGLWVEAGVLVEIVFAGSFWAEERWHLPQ